MWDEHVDTSASTSCVGRACAKTCSKSFCSKSLLQSPSPFRWSKALCAQSATFWPAVFWSVDGSRSSMTSSWSHAVYSMILLVVDRGFLTRKNRLERNCVTEGDIYRTAPKGFSKHCSTHNRCRWLVKAAIKNGSFPRAIYPFSRFHVGGPASFQSIALDGRWRPVFYHVLLSVSSNRLFFSWVNLWHIVLEGMPRHTPQLWPFKTQWFCALHCLQENTDGSLVPVPVRILNIVTQSGRPNLNLGDADNTNDILVHRFLMCDAVSGRESGPGGAGEAYLDGTGYLRVIRWAAHLAVQALGGVGWRLVE